VVLKVALSTIRMLFDDWILPIIVAVVIAIFVKKVCFFTTLVSSYSMYPTLKPKDRILTVRISNFKNINRGDILVFYSKELSEMVIKRVIGLPNEFVEIKHDGSVYINQVKLDEPYVQQPGGLSGIFKVPEKKYMFLGDNRVLSNDSRSWLEPYIFEKDIQGKAIFCLFPFSRLSKLT